MSPFRRMFSALLIALTLALPAWAADEGNRKGPLVLAAASLQEAMLEAADAWADEGHPKPVVSFAASSALARQIEAGAPADLFVSADEEWMEHLQSKGLLRPQTRSLFLANRLVLIGPSGYRGQLTIRRGFPLAQALGRGRLAMADPDSVPAGRYGKAALQKLAVWPTVEQRVARAENVRAAMALVERGAAPFGIVYATDAKASSEVRVVGVFPATSHPPIRYPLAILRSSANPEAEAFRRFLLSPAGKAVFERHGFTSGE